MGWEIDGVTLEQREAVQPPPPPGEAAAAVGLIDDLQSPVVGALTFDQENCDWSLLPAPTPPKSPSLTDETPSTPKNASIPYVGMPFENIHAAEKFYKEYAHDTSM
ncbi:uncharacterized protein LOC120665860 isoform X2 [Panicum virgatum]|uniref:uncharacterized protein LOC120665860 isoform X2 n=1 Tax=Panicum virgatum TaxID=38727 RepID=UPI0019D64EA5|nr:uncharacterized protein LOC120665860 isoform X2 [Panicum virgatum]